MRAACVWLCVVLTGVLTAATTGRTDTPASPPPESCGLHGLHCGCPAVSSLLQAVGFTPACVASSLALCSHLNGENQFTAFVEEMRETMRDVREAIREKKLYKSRPRHCRDLLTAGDTGRGVRQVYPNPQQRHQAVSVYCDHTIDGGGWTVFQHRTNATTTRESFERTWIEYQLGFGRLEGEFWLGLDLLHVLTSSSLQEMRVDLADYDGGKRWAKYGVFYVGPGEDHYRLHIGRYEGDASDALAIHNTMKFSTTDADHDTHKDNCAQRFRGAWWYVNCHDSNLNGYQYEGSHTSYADGINWQEFRGDYYALMNTTMMIRPAF